MHARNSSRDSQSKLIVRSVAKWCKFGRNKKNDDNSDLLHKTHQGSRNALNRPRTGKTGLFFIYWSSFPDGFERLSAEATFHMTVHTVKMYPLLAG